ncbi:LytTR family DNA-binding domain-containing protein [Planococcus koreensis]|uniref:LytTR family DNA-binding domain-containing protein n=1 Tax=Planococcus koreensis TaxID=112331 RepID=UPI0039FCA4F1
MFNSYLEKPAQSIAGLFLPIHRAYIVNIHHIEEITRDMASNYQLTMKDGSVLPVSQNYAASVRGRLGF